MRRIRTILFAIGMLLLIISILSAQEADLQKAENLNAFFSVQGQLNSPTRGHSNSPTFFGVKHFTLLLFCQKSKFIFF